MRKRGKKRSEERTEGEVEAERDVRDEKEVKEGSTEVVVEMTTVEA